MRTIKSIPGLCETCKQLAEMRKLHQTSPCMDCKTGFVKTYFTSFISSLIFLKIKDLIAQVDHLVIKTGRHDKESLLAETSRAHITERLDQLQHLVDSRSPLDPDVRERLHNRLRTRASLNSKPRRERGQYANMSEMRHRPHHMQM